MPEVRIISHGRKNIVWPPCVVVRQGETLTFKAINTEATVFLPKPELFEFEGNPRPSAGEGMAASRGVFKVKDRPVAVKVKLRSAPAGVAPGGKEPAEDVRVACSLPTIYPYAVYCENGNDFAQGNSSPIMILEPPGP